MAIEFSSNYKNIVDDVNKMPGAKWFEGLRFNFAENLLRVRSDKPAIHFQSENNSNKTFIQNNHIAFCRDYTNQC